MVLYSPLQMAADAIENYEGHPALSFIESCPTTWSKTVVPHAKIGEYITVARKQRDGDGWWIGSMTDANARTLSLPLDFLDSGRRYVAWIYCDGADADYESNPYSLSTNRIEVDANTVLTLRLARSGGAAIRILPQ